MHTLSVVVPFFAVILLGFLAARFRVVPVESVPGLNSFVLYIALPAMLFQFGAATPVAQLLDPTTIAVWLVSGLVVLGLGLVTGLRQGRGWLDSSFGGLIAVFPNSGFMGLPLIVALLGVHASGPIVTSLLVDIVLMQSIALALTQQGDAGSVVSRLKSTIRRVAANPMPWSIVLGALWGMTGRSLCDPLDQVVTLLATAATPVALFTIGAVLARKDPEAAVGSSRPRALSADVLWLTGLKLLLHPALVWTLGSLAILVGLPLRQTDLLVLMLVAALPSAANAAMLAERFKADSARIAAVVLTSTVIGFGTFSFAAIVVQN